MQNIKLVIAYDGKNYLGWQKTPSGPSIEESLEKVIAQIVQHPVALQAASRTDAGVHARGQVANFFTSKNLDLDRFQYSLNSLLPKDIVVLQVDVMPNTFHPTLDCLGKEYRYYVCCDQVQLPQHRFYSWHIPIPLDLYSVSQATSLLHGKHDFAAFCNAKKNEPYECTIREIECIKLIEMEDRRLCFVIKGNHFLYKMVRNIVGTLIDIGKGNLSIHAIPKILESKHRPLAGVTAPAHALFLHDAMYLKKC